MLFWQDIVGSNIAKVTFPFAIEKNMILTILVKNNCFLLELQMKKSLIEQKIISYLGIHNKMTVKFIYNTSLFAKITSSQVKNLYVT